MCGVHQHSDGPHSSSSLWSPTLGFQDPQLSHARRSEHVVQRERRLDELSSELLTILAASVPVQNRVRRRRQPSWWNSDCLPACIARNGALRDHRRTPSAESHARFRPTRHAFHRTMRSAQRAFWTSWQDHVSALSVLNPRVAAATVRRTFQPQGEDRHAQQVRWPDCPGGVAQCDSAAHWREHFSSVDVHSGSFDEDFFQSVSLICGSPRRWVSLILLSPLPSCVALYGLASFLLWASMEFRTPCSRFHSLGGSLYFLTSSTSSSIGCSSHDVETQHRGARLQKWQCFSSDQLPPHLPCFLLFQTFRASDTSPYWTSHLFPTRSVSRWFPMEHGCFGQFSRRRPLLPQFHPHVRRFRGHPENF